MSIDSCYEGLIAKLTKQQKVVGTSKHLLSLTTNEERVLYVYDLIQEENSFPSVLNIQKNESVSTYYRNLGNHCFQNKNDFKAWQYYNLSLLHAPKKFDCHALALANRSAVFYSMKKYKECLEDITKVFTMKYPEKLQDKLSKRKELCLKSLSSDLSISDEDTCEKINMDLMGPTNERYPCASTKLEVVFSEEMGRHVIAKEDIKVGEVLVQEDPYFVLLLKSQYLFSCSYCLSRNLNLLPCNHCCFALYCSTKCQENAWKDYHSVECPLMATLIHMDFTKLELLALRTVIKARSDHKDWHSLFKTIQEAESNMNTEYRGHVKINGNWVYISKYYASIHTLASNIEVRSISDIFLKCVSAAVFLYLLTTNTDFLKSDDNLLETKIRGCVASTLLLHIMTSPTNMHELSSYSQTSSGKYTEEISLASAPYAFHSLLNHSCSPNVVRSHKVGTGTMSLYALRPIKKGMQLFDNYGAHHALQSRSNRQAHLKFQYKFTCLCEACVNNWPTYLALEPAKNLPIHILKEKNRLLDITVIEKLEKGDKETALSVYDPLCRLADSLEKFAPCMELADSQETLKQCLQIFKGLVPYVYSEVVEWTAVPPNVSK